MFQENHYNLKKLVIRCEINKTFIKIDCMTLKIMIQMIILAQSKSFKIIQNHWRVCKIVMTRTCRYKKTTFKTKNIIKTLKRFQFKNQGKALNKTWQMMMMTLLILI